jgi:RNA polymerase sigma factor (sigma-70 family)
LARAGNEQAFAAIVERYRRELHAHASRIRSDGRADDIVQQTFLSAYAALSSGTEVRHLRGWLYRILRNEVIRTSNRPILEVELDPSLIASEPLEDAAQRRMLALEALSSIAALPDRQRHVMVASALAGESRSAVAGSMGLSEGAVRQLMHRARATLRAAAAAFTPSPLANWLASARGSAGSQAPEIAIGAGASSAAGVAVKLGAILATGAVASGIVGSQLGSRPGHTRAVRTQPKSSAVVRNVAVAGVTGARHAERTGARTVGASHFPAGARLPTPATSRIARQSHTTRGDHDRPLASARSGGDERAGTSPLSGGRSRGDGGSGGGHDGAATVSPSGGGGPTEHGGGGSAGGDGPGSGGGSTSGGGSGSTSGRDGSTDGGHDGGSADLATVSTTASSDGGGTSTDGSTDGGSSDTHGGDGGTDLRTSGSSSSGR